MLLFFLVLSLLPLVNFFILPKLLFFLAEFLLKLDLFLLFLLDVRVLDGLDDFVELFVLGFFHFAQFAEPSLLELYLISVVLLYCLSFEFMLELKFVEFLDLFFLHSVDLLDLLIVLDFLDPLSFRDLVVELIDKSIIQLLSFLV